MDFRLSKALKEADDFFISKAKEKNFGDITVTISIRDGVPVKVTETFCRFHVERKTKKVLEK